MNTLQIYAHTFQTAQISATDNPQCNQYEKDGQIGIIIVCYGNN
ncbi:MAG: hypothetical protein ACI4I2_04530 [Oscillospiraceae bacterium]